MKHVICIPCEGPIATVDAGETAFETALQLVGGYVEVVRSTPLRAHKLVVLVDEDGWHKHLPVNQRASILLYGIPDGIVGDAVVMVEDYGPEGPELFGLDEDRARAATLLLGELVG